MKERGCIFSVESLFMSLLKRQLILFPGRWFGKGIFSVESIFILLNLFGWSIPRTVCCLLEGRSLRDSSKVARRT